MKSIVLLGFWLIVCGIAGAALLAQVAFALPPNAGGLPGENLPGDFGGGIDCADFVTGSVTVAPPSIKVGDSATLSWSLTIPDRCTAKGITVGGQPVGTQGSMAIQPPRTQSYVLQQDAKTLSAARIEVVYPPRVVIDQSTRYPVQVLIGALVDSTNPEQTVELCDVDLDLTGHSQIVIGENRSLIASPACARGPRSLGPRIRVTDKRGSNSLFVIRASNVHFSGFRLEGPTSGIESDKDNSESGIQVKPFGFAGLIHNIEVSNMEMSHWSGAAIEVYDNAESEERGRLTNENVSAVQIKNNFLHHNRHDGLGYGVNVGNGAYALIEHNVFDENRHAIAGGSSNLKKDYSGYTARENLVLPGGGRACNVVCWQTHQIDMHGDKNGWWSSSNWCCGTAGETIIIERNTILYTSGEAIKIRGNPADKAIVDGNVFKHKSRTDAISQNGNPGVGDNITNPIDVRPNNVFGFDALGKYGVCDSDGDGVDDLFLATGATWWFSSFGEFQWSYLNAKKERLDQVRLGYFDNDLRCDVLAEQNGQWVISSGGTSDWRPLGAFGAPLSEVQFGRLDPNQRDHRPGVTRRTTHAFRRAPDGQWFVTPISSPSWQPVQSSSLPMGQLRFGDFTGDGVTDVLAVVGGRWAISESATGQWRRLNPTLGDPVGNLFIANMDPDDNIDDILRLDRQTVRIQSNGIPTDRTTLTWWRSRNGTEPWAQWKQYVFEYPVSPETVAPGYGFAGRFGAAPGGGTLVIGPDRLGHFYSAAEIATGAAPDWTSLFPY